MEGYPISTVAERTGFRPSTLRFYEDAGLVRPRRTAAGYRCYSDRDVEILRFVRRGKDLGLRLDEITELVALLDGDRCDPVQSRLRELVDARIDDARARRAELAALIDTLGHVATELTAHTPDGACDGACGCTGEVDPGTGTGRPARSGSEEVAVPVVCTLAAVDVGPRTTAWRELLASVVAREPLADGVRLRFAAGTDVEPIVALAAAEQACCSFFVFRIELAPTGLALEVHAPPDARTIVDELFGTAS